MDNKINLIDIYRNYLFALEERKMYGEKYGDTDEIIKIYEEKLGKKLIKDLNKNKLEKK